jgi:hypothetical protein
MRYSTYNCNQYNATVTKDNNHVDIKVGNAQNDKRVPGTVFEYGVKSVNGKYGDVVLTYEDVHALPDTTVIAQYIDENNESYVIESWQYIDIDGSPYLKLNAEDGNEFIVSSEESVINAITNALEVVNNNYVSYNEYQDLTPEQKLIAQQNIGVDIHSVTDYRNLHDKPQINGVELVGNLTSEDLGLDVKIGNGLEYDSEGAIQIEDEVIFNCGTSTTVISHYSGGI